jgi:DNA recombination protein RmuC
MCMTITTLLFLVIIILFIVVCVVGTLLFIALGKRSENSENTSIDLLQKTLERQSEVSFAMLQNQLAHLKSEINDFGKTVDLKLRESSRDMREQVNVQFGESQKLIKEITSELGEVKESNKQVFSMTEQLQNLENVLKHSKQRGNLGEASLELTLSSMLAPTQYELQYQFKDAKIVDAIVKTKEGFIPVDAKFSLDNYTRVTNEKDEERKALLEREFKNDLKLRIDETAKYIRPAEGTLPFAFMFIPAEGIYYDLLVNEVGSIKVNTRNLIDYAYSEKKVIIVSPTTFSAYLMSVLHGFRAFKIEEKAVEIGKRVEELRKHLITYEDYMKKLGRSLGTTVNQYNDAYKELKKVDKDIIRIAGKSDEGIEPEYLEKPGVD